MNFKRDSPRQRKLSLNKIPSKEDIICIHSIAYYVIFCKVIKRRYNMEINEVIKDLSLYENIIVRIHKKLLNKIFHRIRIEIVNKIL